MKKKLLILPIVIICILAGMFIGSCGSNKSANVNANVNNFRQLDSIDKHTFYLWTDPETDKEYILYHNYFYEEFSICPR